MHVVLKVLRNDIIHSGTTFLVESGRITYKGIIFNISTVNTQLCNQKVSNVRINYCGDNPSIISELPRAFTLSSADSLGMFTQGIRICTLGLGSLYWVVGWYPYN